MAPLTAFPIGQGSNGAGPETTRVNREASNKARSLADPRAGPPDIHAANLAGAGDTASVALDAM